MSLDYRYYLWYKFLNSLFLGLSVGSIFVIYTPLKPSIYSLGGIFLAIGTMLIAKFYENIMTLKYFFYINIFVELVVFVFVALFLILNYSYITALVTYVGYQVTFLFGSYLVRMETIALKRTKLLSFADIAKQKGYLFGLLVSYLFYKIEEYFGIIDKQNEVYHLHYILLVLESLIVYVVWRSFRRL